MSSVTPEAILEQDPVFSLDKTDRKAIIDYLKTHQVGNLQTTYTKEKEMRDDFLVDLSELASDQLGHLHQQINWLAPSYFLRLQLRDIPSLSDEQLTLLVQAGSLRARNELLDRYADQLEEATDEILILFAQNGNEYAKEVLIERFVPFVRATTRRLERKFYNIFYYRGYDANDLFQEGIMGLFKAIDDFKIERKTRFKDFSKNVMERHIGTLIIRSDNYKNRALNQSFSYHTPIGSDSEITFEQLLKTESHQPEDVTVNKETFGAIWDILTDMERKVLLLYETGLSYEEIGERVGKNKKAIDNTIQRYRKKGKQYNESFL